MLTDRTTAAMWTIQPTLLYSIGLGIVVLSVDINLIEFKKSPRLHMVLIRTYS